MRGILDRFAASASMTSTITSLLLLLLQQQLVMSVMCAAAGRTAFLAGNGRSSEVTSLPYRRLPMNSRQASNFTPYQYRQEVDHFSQFPHKGHFLQRYYVNVDYWQTNPHSPCAVFAFLGGEGNLQDSLGNTRFTMDLAGPWRSIVVYIEHRYYGESLPFGPDSFWNATVLAYLTVAQAMKDAAVIIEYVQWAYQAQNCPVVAIGCSYSGMLAAWMRLKYPSQVYAALASSAPLLYAGTYTPAPGYYDVVSNDFLTTNASCHWIVKQSWGAIDKSSVSDLNNTFSICSHQNLSHTWQITNMLIYKYTSWAQFDNPATNPVISRFCDAVVSAHRWNGMMAILKSIREGLDAADYAPQCYNLSFGLSQRRLIKQQQQLLLQQQQQQQRQKHDPWSWQVCHELVMPVSISRGLFPPTPWDVNSYLNGCNYAYGVFPNRNWKVGLFGSNASFEDIFRQNASNIIFSNGLRDPYSDGGIKQNLSLSLIAITIPNGSHCLDTDEGVSTSIHDWLKTKRQQEFDTIDAWIWDYHSNPHGRAEE